MTPIHQLLTTLAQLNVKLWVEEDRLRLSAPSGVLTPDLQEQLRQQKSDILSLFSQRNGQHNAIQPANRGEHIQLSFAQQRLWFLAQLEGASATYNLPSAFRLQGRLDLAALQRALNTIVARHEILRTTFVVDDATPFQVIASEQSVVVEVSDLSGIETCQVGVVGARFSAVQSEDRRDFSQPDRSVGDPTNQEKIQRLIDADAQRPFDLAKGPLLHAHLLRLADDDHVLSLTMHHIISDGWSAGILMQEFCTLYLAYQQGKTLTLPSLPLQYADYAIWQQQQNKSLERHLAYWRQHLTGAPPLLELPMDRPRPAQQHFVGDQLPILLDEALTQQLEQLARTHAATLHMTLLAGFAILLSRYSGAKEIVVGTPVANRNRPEIEPLIGFFVNTLALRFDLKRNPSFGELLQQVRQVTLDGYAHQDAPFEQVVELLQPQRQLSHTPLFQVVFNLMSLPPSDFTLPGLTISALSNETKSAKFDLALNVGQSANNIEGGWEYNSELFERTTIERMARQWQHLLRAAVADPNTAIDSLPLFDDEELRQWLQQSQGDKRELPTTLSIQQLFETQVAKTPTAKALIFQNQSLSYAELNRRANQVANYLHSLGARPGMYIGICCERSLELIVGILGILKAGAVYVPLDPAAPPERLRFMIEDAQIHYVLTQKALSAPFQALNLPSLRLDADWQWIATQSTDNPTPKIGDEAPIYLIYTSGSTGNPKGVIVPQRGVVNTITVLIDSLAIGVGDRFLQFVPFTFDASALEFFTTLCSGATLVLHPNPTRLSSLELLRLCEEAQINVVNFTVALWHQWVDDLSAQKLRFPAHLRLFLTGGEKPALERLQCWARLGDHTMTYVCSYGPTEASITSTIFRTTNHAVRTNPPISIPLGQPLPNTSLFVLDDNYQPTPIGVSGEIYLGGAGLAIGYLNQPELSAEKFVAIQPHPNPAQRAPETREGTVTGSTENSLLSTNPTLPRDSSLPSRLSFTHKSGRSRKGRKSLIE